MTYNIFQEPRGYSQAVSGGQNPVAKWKILSLISRFDIVLLDVYTSRDLSRILIRQFWRSKRRNGARWEPFLCPVLPLFRVLLCRGIVRLWDRSKRHAYHGFAHMLLQYGHRRRCNASETVCLGILWPHWPSSLPGGFIGTVQFFDPSQRSAALFIALSLRTREMRDCVFSKLEVTAFRMKIGKWKFGLYSKHETFSNCQMGKFRTQVGRRSVPGVPVAS